MSMACAHTVPSPGLKHLMTELSLWRPEERALGNSDTQEETVKVWGMESAWGQWVHSLSLQGGFPKETKSTVFPVRYVNEAPR